MGDTNSISIPKLIAVPAVITLGITILRLVGELAHWPSPLFSNQAGGGGAIIGISWLPIIFGPYFALKQADAGSGPAGSGKAVGYSVVSLVVLIAGAALFGLTVTHPGILTLLGLALMLGSAFVPGLGWRWLGNTLVAYAFAARIPVLIVMWFAISGNGGAGWGTHYDAMPANLAHAPVLQRFFFAGVLPQMMLWIGWTSAVGALFGSVVAAIARRGKHAAPAAV